MANLMVGEVEFPYSKMVLQYLLDSSEVSHFIAFKFGLDQCNKNLGR